MSAALADCAARSDEPCELPLKEAAKKVADADLEGITEVMAEYTTRYNAGMRSRSENIRLAATMIDGVVIPPGETFSFNTFLGRRTRAAGFKVAGVYENGRTSEDVGGGICQVSTTLYNASLLAALEIPMRSSHSLPVAYVPMGRDAAVSYPDPDLKIKNSFDHPIALAASVGGGSITFKVLGQKHPYEIEIIRGRVRTKENGTRRQVDSSLGYGVERVVHGGAPQRSLSTWRVFKQDGEEVRREELSLSFYRGSPRIVAYNPNAPKPAPKPQAPAAEPAAPAAKPPAPAASPSR
jgi:vancomycin resistance protein YoaR